MLILIANIVTTSKALVTTSVALVTSNKDTTIFAVGDSSLAQGEVATLRTTGTTDLGTP